MYHISDPNDLTGNVPIFRILLCVFMLAIGLWSRTPTGTSRFGRVFLWFIGCKLFVQLSLSCFRFLTGFNRYLLIFLLSELFMQSNAIFAKIFLGPAEEGG